MMFAPPPPPTGAVAAAVAASSQAQGQAHPVVIAITIGLYIVAWIAYFQMIRMTASEFRRETTWEKVIVVVTEILMGLTLLISLGILIAYALTKGVN
jgi:uncharacterized membrane-anchored protein